MLVPNATAPLDLLEPVHERVDAGGESLVAVVEPDVLAEGNQGGKTVTWAVYRKNSVEPVSGGRIPDTLFVDRDPGGC